MRRRKKIKPHNNSGSIADIAFLLLIFFMVTTSLKRENVIPIKLPPLIDNPKTSHHTNKVISIAMNAQNEILMDNEILLYNNLTPSITKTLANAFESDKSPIIKLDLHGKVKYGSYMTLISSIKKAIKNAKDTKAIELYNAPLKQLSQDQLQRFSSSYYVRLSESGLTL